MSQAETSRRTFLTGALAAGGLAGAGILGLEACAPTSSSDPNEPVTLNYWIGGAAISPAAQQLIDAFTKANPHITVTPRGFNGYLALLQGIQSSVAAGQAPEVAGIGYNHLQYAASVLPVTPVADLGVTLDGYAPNIRALGQSKGKQIGAPYTLSVLVAFYNADLLAAAGVDTTNPPTTWSAWHDTAAKIKSAKGVPTINLQQYPGDNFILQAMAEGNGGSVLQCSTGHYAAGIAQPESIEAVDYMAQMIKDGLSLNVQAAQASQAFLAGQTATLITGSSTTVTLKKQAGFTLGAVPFPTFDSKPRHLPGGGNALCSFAKSSQTKAAAAKFINFMTTAENLSTNANATGVLSPRASGDSSDPLLKVAVDERNDLVPWTSYPGKNGLQGAQVISDAVVAVLGGQDSAQTRLTAAAKTIDSLFGHETC